NVLMNPLGKSVAVMDARARRLNSDFPSASSTPSLGSAEHSLRRDRALDKICLHQPAARPIVALHDRSPS
ncbi:hypothetical protein, partial [Sphingomonas sp. 179-A 2A2 NHS]|uniref:hypothetical protein n=1 Tax=Sphingomonas sp. 179-A 2A2 NHS TaxID=3374290 RepID=UPI00387995B9